MRPQFGCKVHKFYRYFFHASDDRQISAEYNDRDSEDEEMGDEAQESSREHNASLKNSTTQKGIEPKVEPAEDVDPALADWLSVDPRQTTTDDDSATEPESDADSVNDDVNQDTDEWITVEPSGSETLDSFHVLVSSLTTPKRVIHMSSLVSPYPKRKPKRRQVPLFVLLARC